VVVSRVTYDDDPPWPGPADGQGAALQLVDPAQDVSRVSNWSDGGGWKFFSYTGGVGSSGLTRLSLYLRRLAATFISTIFAGDRGRVRRRRQTR